MNSRQARSSFPPGLTVCIIVRNDAERLAEAIGSVHGVADAVVVTDTGSTDDSASTARARGARVDRFEWCDDFAAAYNHCLASARTEWVFSLDSDERLHPASVGAVRDAINQDDVMGYDVIRRDLLDLMSPDVYSELWQLRLFRLRRETRYVGRIHHQFKPSMEALARTESRRIVRSRIVIEHTGYVNRDWPAKYRRDAKLMELELQDRPGQFYFLVELGLCLLRLGDHAGLRWLTEAGEQATDSRRRARLPKAPFLQLLEWVLSGAGVPSDYPIGPDVAKRWAREHFIDAPPIVWQLASSAYAEARYEEAARWLDRLIDMGRTGRYDRIAGFDPRVIGDDARLNRAACDLQMRRLDEAEQRFQQLLTSPRVAGQAATNLQEIQRLRRGSRP